MDAVLALASTVGIQSAWDSLGVVRASFYRQCPVLGPFLVSVEPAPRHPAAVAGTSAGRRRTGAGTRRLA